VKLIADRTGRFRVRPHYELDELETECEQIITDFLERRYGQIIIPVPTDALRVLIESEPAALDVHADLSHEGEDVHGITEFFPGRKPWVSIARELSTQPWRAHRERTTLTHEYGHVHWHAPLYDRYCRAGERHKCARGKLLPGAGETDWMEWQAGYISGALLMLRSRVQLLVDAFRHEHQAGTVINSGSVEGRLLIGRVSEVFDVSREAAAVRLLQLGHLLA
jgi:hypothetical protein